MSGPVAPFSIADIAERDPGPMARLEDVKRDEGAPSEVFRLLTADEPMTLRQIAKEWGLPKGRFVEWFTTGHASLYDAALKVLAVDLGHGAKEILDGATMESVPLAKLQSDGYLKLASKWDRKRYGEEADAVRVTPVTIQIANLRGAVEVVTPVAVLPEETI